MNAKFVGFTSGCGGSGTTSAAITFGRSLSRLEEKNVLYIGFDFLCSKCLGDGKLKKRDLYRIVECGEDIDLLEKSTVADDYGLKYLSFNEFINPLHLDIGQLERLLTSLSEKYDVIILDAPCNSMMSVEVLPFCEDIVIVYGFNNLGYQYSDEQLSYVEKLTPQSRTHKLFTDYDMHSFENNTIDIHGEFGSKVRAIVSEITF